MPNHNITIAIDGFSSCGKSTVSKLIASKFNYAYIDTGAMYRAVTLYFLRNDIDYSSDIHPSVLSNISIDFRTIEGINTTYLNNEDVEKEIRTMKVSNSVSPVSAIPEVRKFLVAQQQQMGKSGGVVLDGRDIGTVVFPTAELKLFMTADPDIRAERRLVEIQGKGITDLTFEAVKENLISRDRIDSNREDSPLKRANDAILIDTTNETIEEVVERIVLLVEEKIAMD